ncbi:hypothetical protein [Amycolatopsis vastitatis]|uniref:hypothetical protein n=1 Tax=Amycolatopsis vastitatis TaxID=1905142 RepID=UPI00142DFF02|nr:hypothetical protein [Amycolatopsis vastitatis]
MTAVIYIDPAAIHPVINGVWHRARLRGIPAPGQGITMLCGASAAASFEPSTQRGVPTMCPRCDSVYRREHNIPQQHTRQSR